MTPRKRRKKTFIDRVTYHNERMAERVSKVAGTMWFAYITLVYCVLPNFFPTLAGDQAYNSTINILQVVFPAIIMVGQAVQARREARREFRDHQILLNLEKVLREQERQRQL